MQAIGRNTIRISKSPAQTRRERWRDLNGSPSRQEAPQSANFVAPGQAEIRNKLKIQKLQCPKQKAGVVKFWSFEFGTLDIISDFVLRISDFQLFRKSKRNLDLVL